MACIHGLQQVKGFRTTDFADDDPFRPHTQAILHEVAHGDFPLAFQIGWAGFKAHDMRLLQLQFGRVFAGNDALLMINTAGENIEQSGFARACAARNQHIAAHPAHDRKDNRTSFSDGAKAHQVGQSQLVLAELTDGEGGAIERKWWCDDVDARAVWQAGVANRA